MRESQPWTDLPQEREREPAMDRSTLGERANHGQIYLRREMERERDAREPAMDRSTR